MVNNWRQGIGEPKKFDFDWSALLTFLCGLVTGLVIAILFF